MLLIMTSLTPGAPLNAEPAKGDPNQKAVGVGSIVATTGAVLGCAACCVVPLAFPVLALGASGAVLAWFAGAHMWITGVAFMIVLAAWGWLAWRTFRRGHPLARSTVIMMALSTLMLALALVWPRIEPALMAMLR
jgi:hypothetical protein